MGRLSEYFLITIVVLIYGIDMIDNTKFDEIVSKVIKSNSRPTVYETKQASKLDSGLHQMILKIDAMLEEATFDYFSKSNYSFKKKSVLVVGARLGGEVRAFLRLGALAIGYDFNPGIRNPWAVWGDGSPIQFGDELFDYVIMNIIDHIKEPHALFQEIYRVLDTNGMFFNFIDVLHPNVAADHWAVNDHRDPAVVESYFQHLNNTKFQLFDKIYYNNNSVIPSHTTTMAMIAIKR